MKPSSTAAHVARLAPALRVLRPPGPDPHPVVLQFHGCGGPQAADNPYARSAVAAGVAVVMVDSYAHRGITRARAGLFVCTGAELRGPERAGDVLAALAWARARPWVDPARITLAGWSHGAWAVMEALALGETSAAATGLSDADPRALADLAGVFLVYPYAGAISLTHRRGWGAVRPRVAAIIGGADRVVGSAGPLRALGRLRTDGLKVETLFLPEATHGFDDALSRDPRTRFRADLTERALAFYVASLGRKVALQEQGGPERLISRSGGPMS